MKRYSFYLIFIISFFLSILYAEAYNLRQISNRDGLSNSAILSICQDSDGFMWFGSCDGLNMFNGLNIRVYKPTDDTNNLSGNLIENIIETKNGILWVNTNYGLNKFDKYRKVIESYNQFKGRYFMQKDNDNNIFIINESNSIYYYYEASDSFKKLEIENLAYDSILNFMITSDNVIHIFTNSGRNISFSINKTDGNEISLTLTNAFEHTERLLYCFYEKDNKNTVYLIDETHTLYEYHIATKRKNYIYNLKNIIDKYGDISSVVKNLNDFFIGFKTNGVLRLKNIPDRIENYEIEDIGIKSGIFCLLKDKYQDLIWIGTDGQGVYMYSNDSYAIRSSTFSNFANNIEKPVRALFIDKEKTLWIGTKGDGILRVTDYNPKTNLSQHIIKHNTIENSLLNDNSVYVFTQSKRNILWIGNENGLNYYSYKNQSIEKIEFTVDGKPVKYIHAICELNDSTLWIATVGTGIVTAHISEIEDKPILSNAKRIAIRDGKDSYNYFFTVYKEDDSTLWFGNRGYGAFKLKTNEMSLAPVQLEGGKNNQTLNDIFCIVKDSDSNIWFGSSFGLVKYSPDGREKVFNENNGFPNNTIHGIIPDSQGNLWLSTNSGIIKFDPKLENFQTYSSLNGLQVTEFSDGASFKDKESETMYFGGINGFISISETGIKQNEYLPPIHFDNLMIFGEEKNISDFLHDEKKTSTLELKHYQNFFSISFTAPDYINGNNYIYYYKLDDLSKQWIDNGASNNASFTSLPPGEYTLSIKYKNRLTGNESAAYSILVKILPPWYLSSWAYILYVLLILSILAYSLRMIIKRNERKKQQAIDKLTQQHQEEVYESKLSFFTNIAHEFCTPLTLIYGPCNRILNHGGSDKFVKKYTSLIQRNAERLNDLIQNLIEFRRIDTGNRTTRIESLSVSDIINDTANAFNDLADSRNIRFEKNIQSPVHWNSDKDFIYTIVSNLLSNAFKYVSADGRIRIDADVKENHLLIKVSNTGKGIKKENLTNIFDRYAILDNFENKDGANNYSRNGLGLSISNSMVKLLNGTIEVESELNEWTSFIVKLPEQDVNVSDESKIENTVPEITVKKDYEPTVILPEYKFDKSKLTVLIIDDDTEILWLISEIFAEEYNVIPLSTPLKIEEILSSSHPDIIICDVMMPELGGIELVKRIKEDKKTSHIPLILISAKYTVEEQIEGLASGAEMYISKPFNTDYLKTSVKHLISRKETLKSYFNSPLSAFELNEGKLVHKENTKFVQDIIDIIEKNIMDSKLSAQFIAAELNMSPRHLYRRLNEVNSESPADMIKESRLHIARNLLLNTKMTIDEVIYKSGFSNRATFFRAFAQKYGCTPKEFRDKEMSDL
ncbi:MAG: two-component regulator propeller domain-containing protein [Dysgonomonas sp.]